MTLGKGSRVARASGGFGAQRAFTVDTCSYWSRLKFIGVSHLTGYYIKDVQTQKPFVIVPMEFIAA